MNQDIQPLDLRMNLTGQPLDETIQYQTDNNKHDSTLHKLERPCGQLDQATSGLRLLDVSHKKL